MYIQTFISKYKPYYINDFFMDDKVNFVLKTLFSIDDLNILFIGNSNSGKTTLLYAIIREYYGLSKTDSFPDNNILFINNLKEQGINYYRNEMKTFSQSHSNIFGKKKLIVIDDLDMINEQSQQVFRNYIDKYKNNINFISVCSNIQKVIESIQSRVHILKIFPPNKKELTSIMNKIIHQDNIVIDDLSKEYILLISNNSIRNLINILEKMYIMKEPIHIELCKQLCCNISFQLFEKYILLLKNNSSTNNSIVQYQNLTESIQILYNIHEYGYSVIDILDYFFTFIKTTELLTENEKYKIIPFLCKYITIFHNLHEDVIELALFTNNLYEFLHTQPDT